MTGKDYINDRVKINTSDLFNKMLLILEDINHEHDRHFALLYQAAPETFKPVVKQAHYLDEDKMALLRKRILNLGYESIRQTSSELDIVRVEFSHVFKQPDAK